jgi:hypothetical protein
VTILADFGYNKIGHKRIYIAGPMRGIKDFNFPAFFKVGLYLATELGYVYERDYFSPAEHDILNGFDYHNKTGNEPVDGIREMLAADLHWIAKKGEVILLLPGWEKSRGVAAEVALAKALGLGAIIWNPGDPEQSLVYDNINDMDGTITATVSPHSVSIVTGAGVKLVDLDTMRDQDGTQWMLNPLQSARAILDLPATGEVRVVDPVTGGEKGSKPERFDLIPVGALREVARVYGFGAGKYADHNWRKGYAWHLSYAAALRHVTSFWDGEDLDPESGLPHLAHAAWQMLTLLQFQLDGLGTDDRFKA